MSRHDTSSDLPVDAHVHGPVDRSAVLALRSLALAEAPEILATDPGPLCIGLHPWDVRPETIESDLRDLAELLDDPRVVAVGEAGLDRRRGPDLAFQREAFLSQARIAESSRRPLIVHCVGSASDLLGIRARSGFQAPWILHGWNGSAAQTSDLVRKTDFVFSYGARVLHPQGILPGAVAATPSDRILVESDASGVAIERVEEEVARQRGMSPEDLRRRLHATWSRLFLR